MATKGEEAVTGLGSGGSSEDAAAESWLRRLRLGEARCDGRLEIVPLLLEERGSTPGVVLTREAVESGLLEIVERGSGVVQELLAWNKGDRPVAILEGDTLVGCKQNRVVAHSVVVAPGTSLSVPVGCMERGRWSRDTGRFAVGEMKMSPRVRQRTVADVKEATLSGHAPTLDQSRLWRDVDVELCASGLSSSTSDYYEIVEQQGREARERASALAPAPGQVGVLVLADGALVGLEAAGHAALWSQLSQPTLASYLMGHHRGHERARPARAAASEWLSRLQSAQLRTTPGLGLGQDLDLQAPGLSGVGLALEGWPVHVAVFPA